MKLRVVIVMMLIIATALLVPYQSSAAAKNQFVIINKNVNQLAFYENGKLVKTYSVATGKTSKLTPEGVFTIREKIINRPYYKLHIKGGDPKNPLGDRWMGLSYSEHGTYPIGIHGTNNERSIGKKVSGGCIRMKNKDVHELFSKINTNAKVVIVNSSKSFASLAIPYLKPIIAKK